MTLALALYTLVACHSDAPADPPADPADPADGDPADTEPPNDTEPADTEPAGDSAAPDTCNDGVLDPGEACDDGNDVDVDGCTTGCAATPGLTAWWPLDDAEVLGDTVGGLALTWTPGPTPGTSGPSGAWGRDGSLSFYPGSTAEARLAQRPVDASAGTISAWVRGRVGPGGVTAATIASQDGVLWLGVDGDDRFALVAGPCAATADVALGEDTWIHVAARWSRGADEVSCALSVAPIGADAATTDASAALPDIAPPPGPNAFALGRATAGDARGWRGWIDQVVLFDRPLTDEELGDLARVQDGAWYRPATAAP